MPKSEFPSKTLNLVMIKITDAVYQLRARGIMILELRIDHFRFHNPNFDQIKNPANFSNQKVVM